MDDEELLSFANENNEPTGNNRFHGLGSQVKIELDEGENENRKTTREQGLTSFTQRSVRSQVQFAQQNGTRIDASNQFERLLENEQVFHYRDDNNDDYLYLENVNHIELINKLNKRMQSRPQKEELLREFDAASNSKESLYLYLIPTTSSLGRQDTIFRAFLLCAQSQGKTFEILIHNLDTIAQSEDEESQKLARLCIAQIRYIDCVFDDTAFFRTLFDTNIEKWKPAARDFMISTLPEILTNPLSQQEAAMQLRDMLRFDVPSPGTFQKALLQTLQMLRMDAEVAKQTRRSLCTMCMELDATVLPTMMSVMLTTLSVDSSSTFYDLLSDLSSFLKLDKVHVKRSMNNRKTVDFVVVEIFQILLRHLQLNRKAWDDAATFLNRSKKPKKGAFEELENDEEPRQDDEPSKTYELFDLMLLFAVLSSDHCPLSVLTNLKVNIIANPANVEHLKDLCKCALGFRQFCSVFVTSLISFARHCVWAPDEGVRNFGVFIYKELFVGVEKMGRIKVLHELLMHFRNSNVDCACVLQTFSLIIENDVVCLQPYVPDVQGCLKHLPKLSQSNVTSLFRVLVTISVKSDEGEQLQKDLNDLINGYLLSINEKERTWGIIGKLTQIGSELEQRNPGREAILKEFVEKAEKGATSSVFLRSVFYRHFADVLRENTRSFPSEYILSWTDSELEKFRDTFFIVEDVDRERHTYLESDKYIRRECKLWLRSPPDRMLELVPFFEFLKEAALVKQRWCVDDDTLQANDNHFTNLFFAFEANVNMEGVKSLDDTGKLSDGADYLFHVNDWIRMLLNTFAVRDGVVGYESELVDSLWQKKYFLFLECEKQLEARIKILQIWKLPSLDENSKFVAFEVKKPPAKRAAKKKVGRKPKRARKENNGEEDANGENSNQGINEENNEEDANETRNEMLRDDPTKKNEQRTYKKGQLILLKDLSLYYRQLKLAAIVRLVLLVSNKRKATLYLLTQLLGVLNSVLPKKDKKIVVWELKTSLKPKSAKGFHGDSSTVWRLTKKVLPTVWRIIDSVTGHFNELLNTSIVEPADATLNAQMGALLSQSLHIVHAVFSSKEVTQGRETPEGNRVRPEKRIAVMQLVEKAIIDNEEEPDEAAAELGPEDRIASSLLHMASMAPTIDAAVALLDVFSCLDVDDERIENKMIKYSLAFLRKEWEHESGIPLKGASLNTPVKCILEHYIKMRKEREQLCAIQWLLANKVACLVPSEEKRKSNVYSEIPEDAVVAEEHETSEFSCITKGTFATIYKVFFTALNTCVARKAMRASAFDASDAAEDECLVVWNSAAACFSLLCLMLRVAPLRNTNVLGTAVREGKRFLLFYSKNSSFVRLLEDLPKGTRFTAIAGSLDKVIRAVQIGNRVLQNIGVYAKTSKCVTLLKAMPELRAASETCIRTMHTIMVSNDCLGAFDIGMMKSRNLDGEVITEPQLDSSESSDDDDEAEAGRNDGDDVTAANAAVEEPREETPEVPIGDAQNDGESSDESIVF